MKNLKEVVASSKTAYWAMIYLGARERHRSEPMKISRFKKSLVAFKLPVDLKELYTFFEDLQALGHGKITRSRKVPFMFNWTSNFLDVATAAIDKIESNEDYKLLKMMIDDKKAPPAKAAKPEQPESRSIEVTLPSGVKITIDVKGKETLADLIKTLS